LRNPLVVTDLDGTLLNSKKQVTSSSAAIINEFIAGGGLFTVATARMAHGAVGRLKELNLSLPAIVMNGAGIYDFAAQRYVGSFTIPSSVVDEVVAAVRSTGAGAFVFTLADGALQVGYLRNDDVEFTQYYSDAALDAGVTFTLLDEAASAPEGDVIYIAVVGTAEELVAVGAACDALPGAKAIRYENVYTGTTCLEVASEDAGKENALRVLRQSIPCDGLLVFGDNDNDLGMMAIADISCAPNTAAPSALAAADVVVESHDDDGVAREIRRRFLDAGDATSA
jgi:Cof subfamily protein (haloacid dehalogenase superfamily)